MKPLSYTQISLYQSCPLCYKLQYIDGLKQKDKWYFSFGLTMHTCAEYFFKVNVRSYWSFMSGTGLVQGMNQQRKKQNIRLTVRKYCPSSGRFTPPISGCQLPLSESFISISRE